jgi:putative lipoic acid-binding regulatory protein
MYSIKQSSANDLTRSLDNAPITYHVTGFDRIQFVSDIIQAVTLDGSKTVLDLHFECDGIRAGGRITVRSANQYQTSTLYERLRSVQGVVNVERVMAR